MKTHMESRWGSQLAAVILLALLMVSAVGQKGSAKPAFLQQDDPPEEVLLGNGYRISFMGASYDPSGDTSTWSYDVEELEGSKNLGYWVLELPFCNTVLNASPESWSVVRPDPNTGLSGIKWDVEGEFVEGNFSVSIEGQWNVGQTTVAAKGGADVAYGEIAGPSCDANSAPVAINDEVSTYQDSQVSIPVLQNDIDADGDPLYLVDFDETSAEGGTVVRANNGTPDDLSDDYLIYTPPGGYTGVDSFSYTVSDGVLSTQGSVIIEVLASSDTPVAVSDTFIVRETPYIVSPPGLLLNDQLLGYDTIQIHVQDQPQFGSLTIGLDGGFTYTPDEGFYGEDSFSYYLGVLGLKSNVATVTLLVPDEEPPTVVWIEPVEEGEILWVDEDGVIRLEVEADDNHSISRVWFFRWDALKEEYVTIAEVTEPLYVAEISVSELNPGFNQIFAAVYDLAGNRSEVIFIWLYKVESHPSSIYLPITSKATSPLDARAP